MRKSSRLSVTSMYTPSNASPGARSDNLGTNKATHRPEFKREFSLWTSFCVSFAVLGLLPSFASTLYYGMGYAGTPGMVWGWLIAMSFIQCVAMGMGTCFLPLSLPFLQDAAR